MADIASIALRASPNGSTAGLAVLSDGSEAGAVVIVVLPKPWSPSPGLVRSVTHEMGTTTHLVLYELDTAEIVTERSAAQALALAVTSMPVDSRDEQDGTHRRIVESVPVVGAARAESVPDDFHGALLGLLLIIEGSHAVRGLRSMQGHYARSLLRLLEQFRLVDEIERVIYLARPRYEERHEELTIPKGRIVERTLLRSQRSGVPRVESVFDDLTINTPVLQIAAAALRVTMADQHGPQLRAIARGLRDRAARLVQLLSGVSVLDPQRALLLAERARIGRFDEAWMPSMAAATPVLRGHGVAPRRGSAEVPQAIVLSLPMERAWEDWLERALRATWTDVRPQARARAPWALDPARVPETGRIDFLVRLADSRVAVIDAKYKIDGGYVRSADGYQLFAYSHLAQMDGDPPSLAVLIHPHDAADRSVQASRRYRRVPDGTFALWTVQLPFPSPSELQSREAFADYLSRLVDSLDRAASSWATVPGDAGKSLPRALSSPA